MGAGILPTALYKGKIWFLFGKENQFETSAPGFSDFGGGTEIDELPLDTAIREGGEELTGFLGSDEELRQKLAKSGTYTIDEPKSKYRTYLLRMECDPYLEKYYNNRALRELVGRSGATVVADKIKQAKAESARRVSVFAKDLASIADDLERLKRDVTGAKDQKRSRKDKRAAKRNSFKKQKDIISCRGC